MLDSSHIKLAPEVDQSYTYIQLTFYEHSWQLLVFEKFFKQFCSIISVVYKGVVERVWVSVFSNPDIQAAQLFPQSWTEPATVGLQTIARAKADVEGSLAPHATLLSTQYPCRLCCDYSCVDWIGKKSSVKAGLATYIQLYIVTLSGWYLQCQAIK